MLVVTCPKCAKSYSMPDAQAGRKVKCTKCQHIFVAPTPANQQQPADAQLFDFSAPAPPASSTIQLQRDTSYDDAPDAVPGFLMGGLSGAGIGNSGWPTWLPTALAIAALASSFWLYIAGTMARGPKWNGSPQTLASYLYAVEARNELDDSLQRTWGLTASKVLGGLLVVSLVVSLALLVGSIVFWSKHSTAGKIVTVTAGVLILPCTCFGLA